jgi:hypothetical protein
LSAYFLASARILDELIVPTRTLSAEGPLGSSLFSGQSGLNNLQPTLVIDVPSNRLLESLLEIVYRSPAKVALHPRRIDCIAHIMSCPVLHKFNAILWPPKLLEDRGYYLEVGAFAPPPDIIDLACDTGAQNAIYRGTMVFHMDPVTNIQASSIDWYLLPCPCQHDGLGNELLWELIRAIIVGASGDRCPQSIRPMIRLDEQIRGRFAGRIGARWSDRRLFRE